MINDPTIEHSDVASPPPHHSGEEGPSQGRRQQRGQGSDRPKRRDVNGWV
ncbi:tRNA pseudouridine(55) synthase TruB, partial [Escherichia coli]